MFGKGTKVENYSAKNLSHLCLRLVANHCKESYFKHIALYCVYASKIYLVGRNLRK